MKDEITIDGVVYVPKTQLASDESGMRAVLIRSYAAGVHFGLLKSEKFTESGKVVVLASTRRVWYWDGAASLSQISKDGVANPQKCKFSVILEENEIVNVIETIPLTEKAFYNLKNVPVWKI